MTDELPDLREHRNAQIKARREQRNERLDRLAVSADLIVASVSAYLMITLDPGTYDDVTLLGKIAAGLGFTVVLAIGIPCAVMMVGLVCLGLFNLARWILRGDVEVDPWA